MLGVGAEVLTGWRSWCRIIVGRGIAIIVAGPDSVVGAGIVVSIMVAAVGCCTVDIADIVMEDSRVAGTGLHPWQKQVDVGCSIAVAALLANTEETVDKSGCTGSEDVLGCTVGRQAVGVAGAAAGSTGCTAAHGGSLVGTS